MSILSNTDARRLDQRIIIQQKVPGAQDPVTGEQVPVWTPVASIGENGAIWACVDATKASERFSGQQELAGNDYTVWVRWRDDITANMRIVWSGANLDITGIPNNQKRGRFMSIFATAGVNDG